ncbi:ParB/RepB/Spo0J family partition protein [Kushneria phosphatilytica]|uniref:Probable chromosome-partitioning protein ParB n=1 Tax=Kushneria phosphatilytica TaxID=657387 RepID=A0A1S1NX87_9GAMM|nr:ParB/RepB/Spo0J family partition protein [Kushneria phosphatilytica]OHV08888.1 chromosome partitioning protein ParB [Kushneria phosphatilytica]QEL12610.1 ParB/RepB/Spo0J family partition protein [Kushneria phosphatilytica]
MTRKRALGRGLDALIGAGANARQRSSGEVTLDVSGEAHEDASIEAPELEAGERLERIPLSRLVRGRYQPRRDIQPERLDELAASIRRQGVMQPIVVRPLPDASGEQRFEIIAGERRWRAAQLAELETIPAVVRELDDEAALAMSLIENIQRENLNPVEESVALRRLMDEFELTQQQVADTLGKSRAQIANLLRLLALEESVQTLLERGDLDVGHARALLALKGTKQRQAAHEVVDRGLTVRQTEALVKRMNESKAAPEPAPASPDVGRLETQLGELLGARVRISHGKSGKGRLTIRYTSLEELDGILGHIR